ncbi:MAG: VTT domain-containing protein [Candidatus Binatia bacterium]
MAPAARVKMLIDGAAYFSAVAEVFARARESILILGWDFDSRVQLTPAAENPTAASQDLRSFLNSLVERRRDLQIHILIWSAPALYTLDREPVPTFHPRIHFYLDANHPLGASHHSKIVVVDDAIAFAGGLDLSKGRWDTPKHPCKDSRRTDLNGNMLPPHHDVQITVDGKAAAALGELVRDRWRSATAERLQAPTTASDPWPPSFTPDVTGVDIAIARTEPAYGEKKEVREIEALLKEAIASARHSIYLENQYLSSAVVGDALVSRLSEADGPEVVLVLSKNSEGWLEAAIMDVLRARLLKRLREADRHHRLRVYCPFIDGLEQRCMSVHSKLLVVDDRLVRVGSANLANRSMGLDTECDLAFESGGRREVEERIALFRNSLLAEHLDVPLEKLTAAVTETNSLIAAIDRLRGNKKRTLQPLDGAVPELLDKMIPDSAVIDPEAPIAPDVVVKELVPPGQRRFNSGAMLRGAILLILLFGLAAAWRWTSLGEWISFETIAAWEASLEESHAAPLLVLGAYLLGGLAVFPVTILIAATAFAFGPWTAFFYSLLGCVLSAMLIYAIGHRLGRDTVSRFTGRRWHRLQGLISRHGILAVAAIRMIPVAPYSVVNLAAGAVHVPFRDFVLGTLIGMSPGVAAITFLGSQLGEMIRRPSAVTLSIVAAILTLMLVAAAWFRRRLGADRNSGKTASPERTAADTSR